MKWIIETQATVRRCYEVEAIDEPAAVVAYGIADASSEDEVSEEITSLKRCGFVEHAAPPSKPPSAGRSEEMKTVPVSFDLPVEITKGSSGLYFVRSPFMKGLIACGDTEEEALQSVPNMLRNLARTVMEHLPPSAPMRQRRGE